MTCRYLSDNIVLLDHKTFVDRIYSSYQYYDSEIKSASLRSELFDVVVPYDVKPNEDHTKSALKSRKRKRTDADDFDQTTLKVKESHTEFLDLFGEANKTDEISNKTALEFVDQFNRNDHYDPEAVLKGGNNSQFVVTTTVSNMHYFIPPNCRFFNSDVRNLSNLLTCDEKFDFIVLDPPWWNKYIRRTKAANKKMGYSMLDNECLKNIPLENHIHDETIVAIWCTNSPTHTSAIEQQLCTKWNIKLVGSWYWTKITKHGQPVCSFNESTKKQPYERLFIAVSSKYSDKDNIALEKYIYSVPCAIHSNKPPLLELFSDLLPERPKCLELFARNVYPNFTSIGTEVLKLQNARLFHRSKHEVK
ncbi:N(6)-adenine-specific methyltransferase METTL4 [Ochlerotatus camptorhynchus]|uniref:N(6)-adenine-specific methyltransferase METTL4 n=1 Tax=Ochlerotatus camptorhynchus TaxID=644619 RepID=UPI0031D776FD